MKSQDPKYRGVFAMSVERLALLLLVAQSLCLGYAFALLYASGNTLFLAYFGSDKLPYAYIAIALVVPLFSFIFSRLQKAWLLPRWARATIFFFTAMFFVAWIGLSLLHGRWVAYALLVTFAVGTLLCGIVRGAQAGFLFDARELKKNYPLIIGGEALGVILGGISSVVLARVMHRVDEILLAGGFAMVLLSFIVVFTTRRFHGSFLPSRERPRRATAAPVGKLLRKRYVLLVLLYQILSVMGTRFANYLFLNQAGSHFPAPQAMTQFFGIVMVVATVLSLLFVATLSGRLLTRFGMSLGLSGNPVGVGIAVLGAVAVALFFGTGVPALFWFVLTAVVLDLVLTSGLTDTTVQSSYQPLQPGERVAVQTLVEGVGIPLATGITGLSLLLFRSSGGLRLLPILCFTLGVVLVWTVVSLLVNRDYALQLQRAIRLRLSGRMGYDLSDRSSLRVVERLLESGETREVVLALELLESAAHPSLVPSLLRALDHREPSVRKCALSIVERRRIEEAAPQLRGLLCSGEGADVKSLAIRALCALRGEDIEEIMPYLHDESPDVVLSTVVGLFRYGGVGGVVAAADSYHALASATDEGRKIALARLVGEISTASFYQPLLALLDDESPAVRNAALEAAPLVGNFRLWPRVVANLMRPDSRPQAVAALRRAGDAVLPLLAEMLSNEQASNRDTMLRLIRVCAQSRSERTVALLERYTDMPDLEVELEILRALNLCGYSAAIEERTAVEGLLLRHARRSADMLLAQQEFAEHLPLEKASRLLASAMAEEFVQNGERLFLILSFLYDPQLIMGTLRKLASGIKAQAALAIELLDVTLSKSVKAYLLPLVDAGLPIGRRTAELKRLFGAPGMSWKERLREIVCDRVTWQSGWLRSCAIYAATLLDLKELSSAVEEALADDAHPVRETAAWALHRLDPPRYLRHEAALRDDPNACVARLAAEMRTSS